MPCSCLWLSYALCRHWQQIPQRQVIYVPIRIRLPPPYPGIGPLAAIRWIWQPLGVYDTSSLPFYIKNYAAAGWNNIQNRIAINLFSPYADIWIHNESLPPDFAATTQRFSQVFGSPQCVNHWDVCGRCLDQGVMLQSEVAIDTSVIDRWVIQYGFNYDDIAIAILSHEFGHGLSGLQNVGVLPSDTCAEVQSIMYENSLIQTFCNRIYPQTPCDSNGIYTAYPSPVPTVVCNCSPNRCR